MKQLFSLLLALCVAAILPAQTLLQDAIALRQHFDTTNAADKDKRLIFIGGALNQRRSDLFKRYCPGKGEIVTTAEVEKAFKFNPFLRVEITEQNKFSFEGVLKNSSDNPFGGRPGSGSGGGSGGFSVANVADGLARFLVKRTKQELSMAFFDDFKNAVQKDSLLGIFCPLTRQQMLLVDSDIYQFNDYLETLRETFKTDMEALPSSTESYLRNRYAHLEAGKISIDLLHLAQQLVDGETPPAMFGYLASSSAAIQSASVGEPVLYDMANGFRFLNLVSESLINESSSGPQTPWFTGQEIRIIFSDPIIFRLYLGLLWQQSKEIGFVSGEKSKSLPMRDILGAAGKSMDLFNTWRTTLANIAESAHSMQRSMKFNTTNRVVRPAGDVPVDNFFRYAQSLTDLMQTLNSTGRVVLQRKDDLIPEQYIFLMRQCNSLYFNVRQRNYTSAISNVIYCLNLLGKDKKEIAAMLKYANFIASIAEANSPEEVERAIEIFALPPGSSRMKKQPGRFSIALNAYTGFSGGAEYLSNDKSPKGVGALTAPVGFSCSWGLGKIRKNAAGETTFKSKGSLGFFVPLIDVGAVTAFRFGDAEYQDLPELNWSNILSPGAYLVYDVPGKWPMALGLGGQIGPSLRKVANDALTLSDKGGVRLGGFLTVDIPVTYLHLSKGK